MKSSIYTISIFVLTTLCGCSDDDTVDQASSMEQESDQPAQLVTLIPDPVFEAFLIGMNVDDELDGSVITSNLATVEEIVVNNLDITDLTGIEDCPNLFNLWLQNCNVSALDVSNNTQLQFIYFDNNNVSSIDVSSLPSLEKLSARSNNLSTIDVSNNQQLELLELSDNNITAMTVAVNTVLNRLDVLDNPLTCIEVNGDQLADPPLDWILDDEDSLSLDCN